MDQQTRERPYWRCYCPPPNDHRTGPGLCPTCGRFPHVWSPKDGRRLNGEVPK
jgi:hypothetical protein